MVADKSRRERRLLPEIHGRFESSKLSLSTAALITIVSTSALVIFALCHLGAGRSRDDRLITSADRLSPAAAMRAKLTLASRTRDQAEPQISASTSQTGSPLFNLHAEGLRLLDTLRRQGSQRHPRLARFSAAGEAAATFQPTPPVIRRRDDSRQIDARRVTPAAYLRKIETARIDSLGRRGQCKRGLRGTEKRLRRSSAVQDEIIIERNRLPALIAELEEEHFAGEVLRPRGLAAGLRLAGLITTELVQSESDPPRVDTVITDAPPEAEPSTERVAEMGRRAVVEFRRMLASTGLNIGRLFPQFAPDRAEGGPFVPPPKGSQIESFSQDRLEAMRSLIKSLPLAVPLDHYQLESRFGPRHDPFNRRWSFHTGLDLSAAYMSPVYATAAGVVTYAGYRSDYGKVVEIDHGNGIATVYGHLHRYIVSVGQRVIEHTQIGLLGSTGRSSGPHVHYEIRVNDEPQDPEKFIGLARVIPISTEGQPELKESTRAW
jgi:hypothetical protein